MTPLEPSWERRPLRAPREDGAMLVIPPLADMPAVIAKNRELIAMWDARVLGRPLAELRQLAREEALTAARFVGHVFNVPVPELQEHVEIVHHVPLIVSGHQPELFHPGVWAKNFVLDHLARATGGIGLNLIVDNDAVSSTSIAVPVGSREAPRLESIPFDADAGVVPWEEARLQDETLFRSFADRVATALSCWPIKPLLTELWPAAIERLPAVGHVSNVPRPRLCDLLTVVRREAERRAGLNNLELPISQLCETESFAWFVASLLSDPQQTHAVYNDVVAEYRRANRIRNRQHPVPDLASRGNGWLESPFWIWRTGDSRRGRLFVRATSSELQLANGESLVGALPRIDATSVESVVAQLRVLSSSGWKIRPRALTNTLFARVFLADVFLHGIGGAKYDEMTDRLIARLFGIARPSYLTVTATHHLPLNGWNVTSADVAALRHRLWDFDHTPERILPVATNLSLLPPGEGGRRPDEGRSASEVRSQNPPDADTTHARLKSNTAWLPHPSPLPKGEGIGVADEINALLAEKQRLIAEQHVQESLERGDPRRGSRSANNDRRRRLRAVSQQLAERLSLVRDELVGQEQSAETQRTANSVLCSREFSFALFPDDLLTKLRG